MKIQNPFRAGLFAGLGVLVAIGIGSTITSLATILTYVGAALFLALGLDPMVTWLENRKLPRWLAIIIVLVAFAAAITGLVFAIIPVVVDQVSKAITSVTRLVEQFQNGELRAWVNATFPWLSVDDLLTEAENWLKSLDYATLTGGILGVGVEAAIGIATGVTGAIVVFILTLYFTSSLKSLKRGMYRLVPASRRPRFIELAEQISESVGRFVMGQGALGLTNGILSSLMLGVVFPLVGLPVDYWALLAFIALIGSLIPLVGTISAAVINTLLVLLFNGPPSAIAVGIYYVVYMQFEAYFLSPRIMSQAVKVPGAVVVIAALAGGTLLGLLGALVAIPVAAAIMLIINEVLVPRQEEL